MKRKLIAISLIFPFAIFSQGLINNGAHIVMNGASSNIYIDGAAGNYTSTNGGVIDPLTNGPTITLLGNWVNNSANVGFNFDGSNVVFAGANQTIGGTNFTHFYSVALTGSGTKTLLVQMRVGGFGGVPLGVLSLGSRPLDLNGFDLWEFNPNTTAITASTGYIQSETNVGLNPSQVRWFVGTNTGAFVIPFGLAATQIPLTTNITSGMSSSVSYFIASTRATATTNNTPWSNTVTHMYDPTIGGDGSVQAVVDRWWDLTFSNAATSTLTFSYRGSENTLIVPYNTGTIGAQYWASAWLPNNSNIGSAVAVTAGVGSVTAPGISFSAGAYTPMVLSSLSAPLPVELLNFSANCESDHEIIYWSTASELNNDFFTVERSEDGNNFYEIGRVNGAGTTSQRHDYSFTHPNASHSTAYYRLRQTDYNGVNTISDIIAGENCGANNEFVNAWSSGEEIHVLLDVEEEGNYLLSVFDMSGRKLTEENITAGTGYNNYVLDKNIYANGIYMVKISGNGKDFGKKLLISR